MTCLRNFVIGLYGHGVPLVHLWTGQALVTSPESQSRDPWWMVRDPPSPLQRSTRPRPCNEIILKLTATKPPPCYNLRPENLAGELGGTHIPIFWLLHSPASWTRSPRMTTILLSLILPRLSFLPFSAVPTHILPNCFLSQGLSWVHNCCPNSNLKVVQEEIFRS